ncbi:hypothetical protein ColLi_13546 [Colletotrichum liriopes]|uniref:Uncharacterized protein n=1 Tax=Colletotrichum liriopes TaxID=708192 RepID=A0AA37H0F3_9PEZI|nr:hypothetical protein ColLi_13546 [Colletotrichum liriopes]
MRVSNIVASLSSATLATAMALPFLSIPIGSVTTASIPVASPTNTAVPFSSEATALLAKLAAIDTAITTIKSSIGKFQPKNNNVLDVVEIAKSLGDNGILNLAINNALLQTQSLNVKLTSDESQRITDFFKTNLASHYADALTLLAAKKDDLKNASLKNSGLLDTLLGGNNFLDTISNGLQLGLVKQDTLSAALIKILDPAYQSVFSEVASIIQKILDGSIRVVV